MGQQREKGRYPVNFHRCGDVDQRGGDRKPPYVDSLSIHHSFSRCVGIQATNGVLVRNVLKLRNLFIYIYIFEYYLVLSNDNCICEFYLHENSISHCSHFKLKKFNEEEISCFLNSVCSAKNILDSDILISPYHKFLTFYRRLGTRLAMIRWDIVFSWRTGLNKGTYFSITWAC